MEDIVAAKYRHLVEILKTFPNLAVAFSGGVDSTLLCHAACAAHDPKRVLILSASSCLLPQHTIDDAERLARQIFPRSVRFCRVSLDPLHDRAFAVNPEHRCYICKTTIYSMLLEEMRRQGFSVLVDGTNVDDLADYRPGLQAVREKGVRTPLVEAGFTKVDIRSAASHFQLPNAWQPSSSCLATRIAPGTEITYERLEEIEKLEAFLHAAGFPGCRVRPRADFVLLELAEVDLCKLGDDLKRKEIVTHFQGKGFSKVFVDLAGRR